MIITKKTRLMTAHDTRIRIKLDDPESLTWGMSTVTPADGHEKAVIDWGDGTRTEVTRKGGQTHTYEEVGEYEVRISDDISSLVCSAKTNTSPYRSVYAPMIRATHTTATLLDRLGTVCFSNATNMRIFTSEEAAVRSIGINAFQDCASLMGRLNFPYAEEIASSAFNGATGITELHFSAAHEETIKALPGFDTAFGAANATVIFDL